MEWDSRAFRPLRDSCSSPYSVNAGRGGEPCRLLLQEWTDADRGEWMDQTTNLDSLEEKLLKTTKIDCKAGK